MRVLHPRSPATRGDVATIGSGAAAAVPGGHGADDLAFPPETGRVEPVEVGVHAVKEAGPGAGGRITGLHSASYASTPRS